MKKKLLLAGMVVFFASGTVLPYLMAKDKEQKAGEGDWQIPVAAGVWYPDDGPLPEAPMRYYRVRCWPGCHSGSSLGLYPKRLLSEDHPIFPTSTAGRASKREKVEYPAPAAP